jgi:hypothetical protein
MTQTPPTTRERMQLAIATGHALRTVERCYAGSRTHAGTLERVTRAAQRLGVALPPAAASVRGPLPHDDAKSESEAVLDSHR